MADTPTANIPSAAPPAAPLANPVLPAGIPLAQSNFDRHRDSAGGHDSVPNTYSDEAAHRLNEARAADQRAQQATASVAAQPRQGEQPAQPQEGEPLLKPRNPRPATVRRSNDWEALKAERDQYRAEAERLRGLSGQPAQGDFDITKLPFDKLATHPEITKLKQERDTYYEEVKHTRVEADPEFRAKFDTKREAAIRIARGVSGNAADDVARILSINDPDARASQLADRIKDFSEGSKARIMAASGQIAALDVEREIEIAHRKATWDSTQQARAQREQATFQQKLAAMNGEFEQVWQEACHPEKGVPFLKDDKVKAAVLPDARRVFSGEADARSLAKASLHAALLPHVIRSAQAAWQEVERLQAANSQYASAWPTDDGSTVPEPSNAAPAPAIAGYQYDSQFGRQLEAARQADLGGKQWGR